MSRSKRSAFRKSLTDTCRQSARERADRPILPRDWRRSAGLSQAAVAEMLGIEGLNPSRTWQRYESGEREPSLAVILRIETLSRGAVTPLSWVEAGSRYRTNPGTTPHRDIPGRAILPLPADDLTRLLPLLPPTYRVVGSIASQIPGEVRLIVESEDIAPDVPGLVVALTVKDAGSTRTAWIAEARPLVGGARDA